MSWIEIRRNIDRIYGVETKLHNAQDLIFEGEICVVCGEYTNGDAVKSLRGRGFVHFDTCATPEERAAY